MSDTIGSLLVVGGPGTGKTHYGGQLLKRLRRGMGKLILRGAPENVTPFEEVLKCLGKGTSAEHTPTGVYQEIVLPIGTADRARRDLVWPDYGGEQIRQIVEQRRLTKDWRTRLAAADAWLLFIRPGHIDPEEDILSRPPAGSGKSVSESKSTSRDANSGKEDNSFIPEGQSLNIWSNQAYYIELLQIMLYTAGASSIRRVNHPTLTVILSCWDETSESESGVLPADVLGRKMPMLSSFLKATWEEPYLFIFGLSALGRTLKKGEVDEEYGDIGSENFGYVVTPDGHNDPDLTLPIWATIGAIRQTV